MLTPTVRAAALLLSTSAALAAPQRPAAVFEYLPFSLGPGTEDPHVFLDVSVGDASHRVEHPKDARLARAMEMLPARLADLPMEFDGAMPPGLTWAFGAEVIPIWLRLLQAPQSLRFGGTVPAPALGFAVHETDEEAAARLHEKLMLLAGVARAMGAEIPEDLVQLRGRSLVVEAGAEPPSLGATAAARLLEGHELTEEVMADLGAFVDFLRDIIADRVSRGRDAEEGVSFVEAVERLGIADLRLEFATGVKGERRRTAVVAAGLGKTLRASGILPAGGLTAAHLAPVPADATLASVERVDLGAAFEALNGFASAMLERQGMGSGIDLGDMVKGTTGIDVRDGLLGALGETVGLYASDTTGGGGVTSMVVFMEVVDEDSLVDTKETIEDLLNALAMGPARGYVSVRTWEDADLEYTTLMFPGVPAPLELTMSMNEGWIVMASTPSAARGAMQHIRSGGPSLASRPEVAAALGVDGRTGVTFLDTAYYARIGYGPTSLMMSAVANALRSPIDAVREPGPLMPTFAEFREGILPTVGHTEVRGDDLVSVAEGDGSMIVGLAAGAGIVQEYAVLFAALVAAVGAEDLSREFGFRF
ncbi:MAG: hypothetical protein VX460_11555 [Planctomycetota bacterium]|nr:hypothetical protein [Planctomycetota bacterium]